MGGMSSTNYFLMVLFMIIGAGAAGVFGYTIAKMVLPDASLLAAQQRLGVESAVRKYRSQILAILSQFYRVLVPRIQQIKMPLYRQQKKAEFISAGIDDQFDADEFVALKVVSAILMVVIVYVFALNLGMGMGLNAVIISLLVGFFVPDFAVADIRKRRQTAILRQLPSFMDLLTLSVEAGLDFMAAISRVVGFAKDGPLKDEFNQMMKELQVGTVRADALRNLADRVQLTELSSFATILIQADQMGSSIGPVLRSQSDMLRRSRFQRAERAGASATQKLLLPLVVFILPSIFIVILGPMICDIVYNQEWLKTIFGG